MEDHNWLNIFQNKKCNNLVSFPKSDHKCVKSVLVINIDCIKDDSLVNLLD